MVWWQKLDFHEVIVVTQKFVFSPNMYIKTQSLVWWHHKMGHLGGSNGRALADGTMAYGTEVPGSGFHPLPCVQAVGPEQTPSQPVELRETSFCHLCSLPVV